MGKLKSNWPNIKTKLIQLFGGLVMEKDSDSGLYVMSTGKLAFWILFLTALGIWISGGGKLTNGISLKDIPPNMLTALLSLMGYNFGKKLVGAAQSIFGGNSGPQYPPLPPNINYPINPNTNGFNTNQGPEDDSVHHPHVCE